MVHQDNALIEFWQDRSGWHWQNTMELDDEAVPDIAPADVQQVLELLEGETDLERQEEAELAALGFVVSQHLDLSDDLVSRAAHVLTHKCRADLFWLQKRLPTFEKALAQLSDDLSNVELFTAYFRVAHVSNPMILGGVVSREFDPMSLRFQLGGHIDWEQTYKDTYKAGRVMIDECDKADYLRSRDLFLNAVEVLRNVEQFDDGYRTGTELEVELRANAASLSFQADQADDAVRELLEARGLVRRSGLAETAEGRRALAQILVKLGEILAEEENFKYAARYQEKAIEHISELSLQSDAARIRIRARLRLIDYLTSDRRFRDAETELQTLLSMAAKLSEKSELHTSIVAHRIPPVVQGLNEKQGRDSAFLSLFDETPLLRRAVLGEAAALTILQLDERWENYKFGDETPERDRGGRTSWLLSRPLDERQILALLNADRDLVKQAVTDCRTLADSKHAKITKVSGALNLPTEPGFWEHRARHYLRVLLLQRMADLVTADEFEQTHNDILFPEFEQWEITLLSEPLENASAVRSCAIAPGFTADGVTKPPIPYLWEIADHMEGQAEYPQKMLVRMEEFVGFDTPEPTIADIFRRFDNRHITRVFEFVARAADKHTDRPLLRKCTVPKEPTTHQDYLLGECDEDSPVCGLYYIAERKNAHTCGADSCQKNFIDEEADDGYYLERALEKRARQLMEDEWRGAVGDLVHFGEEWQSLGNLNPKEKMFQLRARLKAKQPNGQG